MKRVHIILSSTAVALVVAIGSTTPTLAAVCENVTFSFTNRSEGPIQVTGVGYRDLNSGDPNRRRVENVPNLPCASGDTCETDGDDLGSITRPRENHDLTDVQFRFRQQDRLGAWQADEWSDENVPADLRCTDRRNYGPYDIS